MRLSSVLTMYATKLRNALVRDVARRVVLGGDIGCRVVVDHVVRCAQPWPIGHNTARHCCQLACRARSRRRSCLTTTTTTTTITRVWRLRRRHGSIRRRCCACTRCCLMAVSSVCDRARSRRVLTNRSPWLHVGRNCTAMRMRVIALCLDDQHALSTQTPLVADAMSMSASRRVSSLDQMRAVFETALLLSLDAASTVAIASSATASSRRRASRRVHVCAWRCHERVCVCRRVNDDADDNTPSKRQRKRGARALAPVDEIAMATLDDALSHLQTPHQRALAMCRVGVVERGEGAMSRAAVARACW
jgi:hypothetical protein